MAIIIKSSEGNVRNVARNATTAVDWRLEALRVAEGFPTAQNVAPKLQPFAQKKKQRETLQAQGRLAEPAS